ncbi:MAG TPA: POTRA domain-containing protein, partial [Pseudidiomarina sp.]|nr:POTRA domain-containing protein [Pseudidiomarina sp.]
MSRLLGTFYSFTLLLLITFASSVSHAQSAESAVPENEESRVVRVQLSGLNDELERNVRTRTTIFSLDGEPAPASFRLRFLQRRAENEIREALMPFGFYQPTIESSIEETPSTWTIQFNVNPGQPVVIETIDIAITGAAATDEKFV